ncbi:MAG: PIN domain-containing protein [Candidatus Beckwithbacteria bacterium]|nr:PIN domain-containing protein [Patescibacteria group bacterium]
MKIYYLDANAVLRYFLSDIASQFKKVKECLLKAKEGKVEVRLCSEVIMEVEFVLRKYYGLSRNKVIKQLLGLIKSSYINMDDKGEILEVMDLFRKTKIDFVDILLFVRAKNEGAEVLSFDKDFKKLQRLAE